MYSKKTIPICIFILAIAFLTVYLAVAQQPEYLEEREKIDRSKESIVHQKMEEVREEIERLNEKLRDKVRRLHELESELKREPLEKRIQELEKLITDTKIKIENLKREHASEEKIRELVRRIEEWKQELEEIHRPKREREIPRLERRIIVIRLEHAPADYLAEIIEEFLSPDGVVSADMRTNSLIIRDVEPNLHDIEMIVHELDQPEEVHYTELDFTLPEHGREIAKVVQITEDFIVVDFPEHWEWQEVELWIPSQPRDDDIDKEIREKVDKLGIDILIEVEWRKREGDDRLWIVDVEPLGLDISIEEMQEMMNHAMEVSSPEEAVKILEEILEYDSECRTLYGKAAQIMLGVNLMKLGKLEEAEETLEIGLNLFPEKARNVWTLIGYEALGDIYRKRNQLDKAIDIYQKVIELYNPNDRKESIIVLHKRIRMKLAQVYIQTGHKELARDILEFAVSLEEGIPKLDARIHLMLGELDMENGDLELAKDEFQEVLNLAEKPEADVSEEDIEKAKEYLKKIEESE